MEEMNPALVEQLRAAQIPVKVKHIEGLGIDAAVINYDAETDCFRNDIE